MAPSNILEIIIVVIPCTAMLSTVFFLYWYNVENAKLNKKIAFYKKNKYYPYDDMTASYLDFKGWSEESYSSIPPQKNFPILSKNELFRTELKTRNQIFRLFKISGLTFLGSLIPAGLIMEFFLT